jgi:hypothetical protein
LHFVANARPATGRILAGVDVGRFWLAAGIVRQMPERARLSAWMNGRG